MDIFSSERLTFRRITAEDLDAMIQVYGDPETVRYVGDGNPLTLEQAKQWIEITDLNFEKRGYGMIAMEEASTNEIVGFAGIVHPGQQPEPEVKYALHRNQWGRGLATEAVVELVRYAQNRLGISWLMATVAPGNTSSQKVLQKAGFSHVRDIQNDDNTKTQVWEIGEKGISLSDKP